MVHGERCSQSWQIETLKLGRNHDFEKRHLVADSVSCNVVQLHDVPAAHENQETCHTKVPRWPMYFFIIII